MVVEKAFLAARQGDIQTLKVLFAEKVLHKDVKDPLGATPVHHAARSGKLTCLRYLVEDAGLPGNCLARNGASPAHDAAATGNLACLQWLITLGRCRASDKDCFGATVLHLACRFCHHEITDWLLKGNKVDPSIPTDTGVLPVHYSAAKGDLPSLRLLLGHSPGVVDAQTKNGATAVYLASQEGHLEVVQYLVKDCGAEPRVRANDGMTPLHAAAQMGHTMVIVWLMSFTEIGLSDRDGDGATAMHFAASRGHAKVLSWLLLHGGEIVSDCWGGTPLHDAAENGELECCQILVVNGVDLGFRDKDGFTAADLAEYNGHAQCAKYLRTVENMSVGHRVLSRDPSAELEYKQPDSGVSSPHTNYDSNKRRNTAPPTGSHTDMDSYMDLLNPDQATTAQRKDVAPPPPAFPPPPPPPPDAQQHPPPPPPDAQQHPPPPPPSYAAPSPPTDQASADIYLQVKSNLRHVEKDTPRNNPDRLRRVDSNRKSRNFNKQPSTGDYYKALGSDPAQDRGPRAMVPNEQVEAPSPPPTAPLAQPASPPPVSPPVVSPLPASAPPPAPASVSTQKPPSTNKAPSTQQPPSTQQSPSTQQPPSTNKTPSTQQSPSTQQPPSTNKPPSTQQSPSTQQPPSNHKAPSTTKPPSSGGSERTPHTLNGSVGLGYIRRGSLVDVEALVPTHDEQGVAIPEWKRQVMVRKLQAKMQEEEDLKRKVSARGYGQPQDWHYSHTHNAILGPFGELMTEADLIRIERQIENLQVMHKVQAVEKELEQLERELTQLLPVSAALSHHQHFSVNPRQVHGQAEDLPEWCSKISTLLKNMAILLATLGGKEIDILDLVYSGYIQEERKDPRAVPADPALPLVPANIGRSQSFSTREDVEREIKQCGVSVKNLKANYELQSQPKSEVPGDSAGRVYKRKRSLPVGSELSGHRSEPILEEDYVASTENVHWSNASGPPPSGATGAGAAFNGEAVTTPPPNDAPLNGESSVPLEQPILEPHPEPQPVEPPCQPDQPTRSLEVQTDLSYMQEWTDLKKERIVFLFLEHWRKYTFAGAVRPRLPGRQSSTGSAGEGSQHSEDDELIYLMKEKHVVGNLICHWRTIFSQVPSRQIRRLSRAQIIYWPQHFLPHVNGMPVAYDSLTLDLFMLGYFQLLEMTMTRTERKFRHLLCFEMFDRVGTHSWELIRQFHREVMEELEAGRRVWANGFEDIKQRYFRDATEEVVADTVLPLTVALDPPAIQPEPGPGPTPQISPTRRESLCDAAPVPSEDRNPPTQQRKDSLCVPVPTPPPMQDSNGSLSDPVPAPVQQRRESVSYSVPIPDRKESVSEPAPRLEKETAGGSAEQLTPVLATRKDSIQVNSDLGEFSNEEICRYIDRSFSFWKEKEAELFDM
ncbi:espin-like protein [Conger conger]|uniref:espin-like protein n=1 Tax=Conger conger TaxID=82655 RepID=UPI002A5ACAD0|nr:espin-like protein [Conger conger]